MEVDLGKFARKFKWQRIGLQMVGVWIFDCIYKLLFLFEHNENIGITQYPANCIGTGCTVK